MFYRFIFSQECFSIISKVNIISFSYTELVSEPSLIHSHPYAEVIVPLNDYGIIMCRDEKIKVKSNSIYIINSNVAHTEFNLYKDAKENNSHAFKYFVVKIDHTIDDKNTNDNFFELKNNSNLYELKKYLENAYKYLSSSTEKTLCILNLSCFYYKFIEEIKSLNYTLKNTLAKHFSMETNQLEYYISKNYNTEINLKEIAEKMNISHNSLTNKFKADIGCTPKEYILRVRISNSKHLLSTTNYTISEIAYLCGFISAAYFTLQFKKHEKKTPKEYRHLFKKNNIKSNL